MVERSKPVIIVPNEPKTIKVKDRDPITMTIGDNVTALTNTSVTIRCHASGVPTPTVTWTKDGQKITSSGIYIVQADASLLIRESYEVGSARYVCTAKSVTGKVIASSTVQIVGE